MARLSRRDLLRNAAYGASAALTTIACTPPGWLPFRPPAPSPPVGEAASLPEAPRDVVGSPLVTVHVGVNRIMPEAALYFAIDRGHFRQAGMAVELVPTSSGVESMQLLAGGQVDVSFAGVTAALFNVLQRGHKCSIRGISPGAVLFLVKSKARLASNSFFWHLEHRYSCSIKLLN